MTTIVVQYLPRADLADDNQRLVEDVFAELAQTQPDGIRYATWCLADDTFLHIAELSEDSPGALSSTNRRTSDLSGERSWNQSVLAGFTFEVVAKVRMRE